MNNTEQVKGVRDEHLDDIELDLSQYVGMLIENRWLILGVALFSLLLATLYAYHATPIYRADALVQIEKNRSARRDQLSAMMGEGGGAAIPTEVEIIKSRNIIGEVVRQLNLGINVTPKRFPLIGDYIARRYHGKGPARPWAGLSGYAWGGEKLIVNRFDLAERTQGAYKLVAGQEKSYTLQSMDGREVLRGRVGEAAGSEDGYVQIYVSELQAQPGTTFIVSRRDSMAVIRSLQGRLTIVEKGRGTGILSISLEGADRKKIRNIINTLAESYLRQSVEKRSEESERMLAFINQQLPVMRTELDAAEQALNLYREKVGTIDLSMESQNLIGRISTIEGEISQLNIQHAELKQTLTEQHPVILGVDEKVKRLQEQKASLDKQLRTVPEKELESVKLSRDVTVASQLYMLLLNKSQELKVTKAGTMGNVRIIDDAVASAGPIKPLKQRIMMLGLAFGLVIGIGIAMLRKMLNKTIQDPAVIEKQLGYAVYAEIPFSQYQEEMVKKSKKQLDSKNLELLANVNGDDQVIESLRSLRTSIQFALMEAENNLVSISGPSPGIGKSFVSANFAYLMAESGKKILLIDADMRKGHLARYFNVHKQPGLSETLAGETDFTTAVNKGALHENLDFLATGVYPPNPSEMLMSDAFKDLLAKQKSNYDLLIIDTPPVLAVTDAAIIGQYASTNFMVLRSGQHHLREIQTAFRRFDQNGVAIKGAIFNGIEVMKGRYGAKYGYGYKYYGYQYDYSKK